MSDPAPGKVVAGSYRLGSKVRSGQFGGSVWRGWTVDTQARVTVVFPSTDDDERRIARRFLIIAAVQHPHLATPIDHGFDELPYIVYEGLEGETLAAATPRGRFTVQEALRLAEQLLGALEAAHGRGLVHGALDGDCVFLIPRAHGGLSPKILGFGLDAGAGSDPQDDVVAAAAALVDIFEQIVAADAFDAAVPDGLVELLASARDKGDPGLAEAAELRRAIDDLVQRQRRPRTGRDARVLMSTAPSMKRAMHDVMLQTSEQAAIPLDLSFPGDGKPVTTRSPRAFGPEPLVPVAPALQVRVAAPALTPAPEPAEPAAMTTPEPAPATTPEPAPAAAYHDEAPATAPEPQRVAEAAAVEDALAPPGPPPSAAPEASEPAATAPEALDPAPPEVSPEWAAPPSRQLGRADPDRPAAQIGRPVEDAPRPQPRPVSLGGREYVVTRPERPHPHPGQPTGPRPRTSDVPAPTVEVPLHDARRRPAEPAPAARSGRAPSWAAVAVFAVLGLLIVFGLTRGDRARYDAAPPAPAPPTANPAPVAAGGDPGPAPGPVGVEEPGPGAGEVTRLTLRSTPSKAVVRYQGSVLGATPIELEVPDGSHRFDLSLDGYRPLSVNVEGRGSQSLTHDLVLEPLPAAPHDGTEDPPGPPTPPEPSGPSGSGPSPAPPGP